MSQHVWPPRSLLDARSVARALAPLALGALIVGLVAPAAGAEMTWQPEGRIFLRYGFPVQGYLPNPNQNDTNFQLVDARFGSRLSLLPGLSLRGVGQVLATGVDSRYPPVLRWGYAEYSLPWLATLRAGQIPTPWAEDEEQVVGDPIVGEGIALTSGFWAPGGLGASLGRQLAIAGATASAEVAAFYAQGLLGNGETTPNPIQPEFAGSGPAMAAHLGLAAPGGWSAHAFARYGVVQDEQAGAAAAWDGSGWHLVAEAVASASNPTYTLATGALIHDALATDAAALLGARYNLGAIVPSWYKLDLFARASAVFTNALNTTRATDSVYPVSPPGASYLGDAGLLYEINDFSDVALDAQLLRQVQGSATQSVTVGVRVGLHF